MKRMTTYISKVVSACFFQLLKIRQVRRFVGQDITLRTVAAWLLQLTISSSSTTKHSTAATYECRSCKGSVNSRPRENSIKTTSLTSSWKQNMCTSYASTRTTSMLVAPRNILQTMSRGFHSFIHLLLHLGADIYGVTSWHGGCIYRKRGLNSESVAFVSLIQLPGTDFLLTDIISLTQNSTRNGSRTIWSHLLLVLLLYLVTVRRWALIDLS